MMNIFRNIRYTLLVVYYKYIKYRKYTPHERSVFIAYEFGIRARKDLDTVIPTMLKVNIERIRSLYEDESVEEVSKYDKTIQRMQSEYNVVLNGLEEADKLLWRMVFVDYVKTHTDEECAAMWKSSKEEISKMRVEIKESNGKPE